MSANDCDEYGRLCHDDYGRLWHRHAGDKMPASLQQQKQSHGGAAVSPMSFEDAHTGGGVFRLEHLSATQHVECRAPDVPPLHGTYGRCAVGAG